MTYASSQPSLGAVALVAGSYRTLRAKWRDCAVALALPSLIDTLVRGAIVQKAERLQVRSNDPEEILQALVSEANLLRLLAMLLVNVIAITLFAVSWHRLALLGERPRFLPQVGPEHVRFALLSLVLIFITTMIALSGAILAASTTAWVVLVLTFIALVVVYLKLSLLFPAAALDARMSLGESWSRTRGATLTLFWAVVLGCLPAYLLLMIVSLTLSSLIHALFQGSAAGEWLTILMQAVLSYLPWAVVIGIVSLAYRQLAGPIPAASAGERSGHGT